MTGHGSVREEAERLVSEVFTRLGAAGAASGLQAAYDPQRAQRVAQAAGDVAVAVTGLLRELAKPGPDGRPAAAGLREDFVRFTGGLLEAAGVDLHAAPSPPEPPPWRGDTEPDPWRRATRDAAAADADPWRAATWTDGRAARGATTRTGGATGAGPGTDPGRGATSPDGSASPSGTADHRPRDGADAERKSQQ